MFRKNVGSLIEASEFLDEIDKKENDLKSTLLKEALQEVVEVKIEENPHEEAINHLRTNFENQMRFACNWYQHQPLLVSPGFTGFHESMTNSSFHENNKRSILQRKWIAGEF